MARLDMVQSHLEKVASSIWQGAKLGANLEIRVQHGSAVVEIFAPDEHAVTFRCILARGVPATPGLYEWLNAQNRRDRLVKICRFDSGDVGAFIWMLAEEIDANGMRTAVSQLGRFADEIDEQLVGTYGGTLANPPPSPPAQPSP